MRIAPVAALFAATATASVVLRPPVTGLKLADMPGNAHWVILRDDQGGCQFFLEHVPCERIGPHLRDTALVAKEDPVALVTFGPQEPRNSIALATDGMTPFPLTPS
jgi:hypothetical protein